MFPDEGGAIAIEKGREALPADLRTIVEAWQFLDAETRAKLLAIAAETGIQ